MPHSMQRRSPGNNYRTPGLYHITINVHDRRHQSLGKIIGDIQCPDGHPDAPRVELTAIGKMVEYELLHSITRHYPVIEIQDYVVMPEHLHFIVNVKNSLISKNGRQTHLSQVIAGFKNGCNRRYWEIIGQAEVAAKPQPTTTPSVLPAPPVSVTSASVLPAPPVSVTSASVLPAPSVLSAPPSHVVAGGFATSIYNKVVLQSSAKKQKNEGNDNINSNKFVALRTGGFADYNAGSERGIVFSGQ